MKYRGLIFFCIFAVVFIGADLAAQAIGVLPPKTFSGILVQAAIVSFLATVCFMLVTKRRQKKSA